VSLVIYGVVLVTMVTFLPRGIIGGLAALRRARPGKGPDA
jgi:ABC-type branched-subunit amino acid transport system permease subunit